MKVFASLSFDDGAKDHFTRLYPILKKYHFKGSFYIITNQVGLANRMTWSQIETLYKEGNEIGSHTHTHPYLTKLLDAELDSELGKSKEKLSPFNVSTLAYPSGDYDERVISFTKKYYFAARACGDIRGNEKNMGVNNKHIDRFALKTLPLTFPRTLSQFPESRCWLIFVVHEPPKMTLDYALWVFRNRSLGFRDLTNFLKRLNNQVVKKETTIEKLAKLCHFLKENSVEVVTIAEGARIFCKKES